MVDVMSYTITVAVEDGTVAATMGGEVPEGEFVISGHEDDSQRTLAVTRRGPDGRYVGTASHVHYKGA